MSKSPIKEEVMSITVYSDGTTKLIVRNEERPVTKIDFHAGLNAAPTLSTDEFVVSRNNIMIKK